MDVIARIQQFEEHLREATLTNDVALHQQLLADNWMNTNANGTVTTKLQLLQLLQSTPFNFTRIADEDVVIRVYRDAAIVTGRSLRERLAPNGSKIVQHVRFTRMYVHLDGRWQVVAAQATPIPN